jgi:hypothetical protein
VLEIQVEKVLIDKLFNSEARSLNLNIKNKRWCFHSTETLKQFCTVACMDQTFAFIKAKISSTSLVVLGLFQTSSFSCAERIKNNRSAEMPHYLLFLMRSAHEKPRGLCLKEFKYVVQGVQGV